MDTGDPISELLHSSRPSHVTAQTMAPMAPSTPSFRTFLQVSVVVLCALLVSRPAATRVQKQEPALDALANPANDADGKQGIGQSETDAPRAGGGSSSAATDVGSSVREPMEEASAEEEKEARDSNSTSELAELLSDGVAQVKNVIERRAGGRAETITTMRAQQSLGTIPPTSMIQGSVERRGKRGREISVWNPPQWENADAGPELLKMFSDLGFEAAEIIDAYYGSDPSTLLDRMKYATGATEKFEDCNYVWTSQGRMAIKIPEPWYITGHSEGVFWFDPMLRSWTADLGVLHSMLIELLEGKIERAKREGLDTNALEKELSDYDIEQICENGDWKYGIALKPFPKFFLVSRFLKNHFPDFFLKAEKLDIYKLPGTKSPPFLQLKVHGTCVLFKGIEPGTVKINPEFANEEGTGLQTDLSDNVFKRKQLAVEIIGGKPPRFPDGLTGKLTFMPNEVSVIPVIPRQTKKFDPFDEEDEDNSYYAFKCSHPIVEQDMISVWNPQQWKNADAGPELLKTFKELGFETAKIIDAYYGSDPSTLLDRMKAATGATEKFEDCNYVWTRWGRQAIKIPEPWFIGGDWDSEVFQFETELKVWIADIGVLHSMLIELLEGKIERAKREGLDTNALEEDLRDYDVKRIAEKGDWKRGISLKPPKFFLVSNFLLDYFPDFFRKCQKMDIYKKPGRTSKPFLQLKVQSPSFLFRGNKPGTVKINPEFANSRGTGVRTYLSADDFSKKQLVVEILGDESSAFPDGVTGKLSFMYEKVFVVPVHPLQTKKFDPFDEKDEDNSYYAFKCSHPVLFDTSRLARVVKDSDREWDGQRWIDIRALLPH